jgi:hypothetical protein
VRRIFVRGKMQTTTKGRHIYTIYAKSHVLRSLRRQLFVAGEARLWGAQKSSDYNNETEGDISLSEPVPSENSGKT